MSKRTEDIDFLNHLEGGQYIRLFYRENDKKKCNTIRKIEKDITNEFMREILTIFQKCFTSDYSEAELVEEATSLFGLEEYQTALECISEGKRKEQIIDLYFACTVDSCKDCLMFMSCSQFDKKFKSDFLTLNFDNKIFQMTTSDYSIDEEITSRHHLKWKSEMFLGYLLYWITEGA